MTRACSSHTGSTSLWWMMSINGRLGPEGSQGVLTAHLAQGEHPQPGLPLCGPWHLQVTCEGWVGISHALSSSSNSPAQPAATAIGSLSSCAMK